MKRPLGFFDVDTQYDFMASGGALYVAGANGIIANLKGLMDLARRQGIPVIATMDAHVPNDPEFAAFPPHCVKGTAGAAKIPATRSLRPLYVEVDRPLDLRLVPTLSMSAWQGPKAGLAPVTDEVGIAGGDIVLEKRSYDVFSNPNAEKVLEKLAIPRYIVFGVATDYCVRAAVLGLRGRGYQVTVVSDAIAAVNIGPTDGERSLEEMREAGAEFATTAEVLTLLSAREVPHVA